MAFPTAQEIKDLLPSDTAVTTAETQRHIDTAKLMLAQSHATTATPSAAEVPDNGITNDLVYRYAEARSWKSHYMKGEGWLETNPADALLEEIKQDFDAYDASRSTEAEEEAEAPRVIVTDAAW